ncbi:DNA repair protein RecO [Candidatus Falkowbacteria bacterium CG1_02_37_21]|nr:MAG: DNA repair protein RecO [Candidatus Falkowbacteria bacterium CG1_02_37_21]
MEATKNSPALILQRRPYREHDSLITAYTLNFGKLSLVARGTKKLRSKLASHLEPLTLANLMIIKGRGFDYIGSALLTDSFSGIRSDLNKLYYAGRVLKLFDRLVRDSQTDGRLFFLLLDWLKFVDAYTDEFSRGVGELLSLHFTWRFLRELGYEPALAKCLICKKELTPGKNYFNLLNGGIVCESCFVNSKGNNSQELGLELTNLLTISDNCVKIIRFIINNPSTLVHKIKINKKLLSELGQLTQGFLNFVNN